MKLKNELDKAVHAHWAANLINAIRYYRTGDRRYLYNIDIHSDTCAYCKKYGPKSCENCPVTDVYRSKCRSTPWLRVSTSLSNMSSPHAKDMLVEDIQCMCNALRKVYGIIDQKGN